MARRVGQVNSDLSYVKSQRVILVRSRSHEGLTCPRFECVDYANSCLRQRRSSVLLKFVRVFEKVYCFRQARLFINPCLFFTKVHCLFCKLQYRSVHACFRQGPLINKIFRSYNRAFENGMRLDCQEVDYNYHNSADVVAINAKVINRFAGCLENSDLETSDLRPQTSKTQTSKPQTSKLQTP